MQRLVVVAEGGGAAQRCGRTRERPGARWIHRQRVGNPPAIIAQRVIQTETSKRRYRWIADLKGVGDTLIRQMLARIDRLGEAGTEGTGGTIVMNGGADSGSKSLNGQCIDINLEDHTFIAEHKQLTQGIEPRCPRRRTDSVPGHGLAHNGVRRVIEVNRQQTAAFKAN